MFCWACVGPFMHGVLVSGIVLAVVALIVERWRRRW